jgi:TetR/AcrR family transcriptional regulator
MARARASDHDTKRRAILDRATKLFAERGYARSSMSEIAHACGTSKALLYHYYENKEHLLFDILHAHFTAIEEIVTEADKPGMEPRQRLHTLVDALLVAYEGADATHRVQINDLGSLPAARQDALKDFERRLVARFASALAGVNPSLKRGRRLLKPVTMSLFGMVNWSYLWFKADGPMSRAQYAELVTRIMTEGISGLGEASADRTGSGRAPGVTRTRAASDRT